LKGRDDFNGATRSVLILAAFAVVLSGYAVFLALD
jgi:hypothetical protein